MKNHLTKWTTSFLNEVKTQLHLDAHMNPTVPVELRLNPRNAWCPRDRLKHSTVNTMEKPRSPDPCSYKNVIINYCPFTSCSFTNVVVVVVVSSPFGLISNFQHSALCLSSSTTIAPITLQSAIFCGVLFYSLLSFLFAIFDNKTSSLLHCTCSPPLSHRDSNNATMPIEIIIWILFCFSYYYSIYFLESGMVVPQFSSLGIVIWNRFDIDCCWLLIWLIKKFISWTAGLVFIILTG